MRWTTLAAGCLIGALVVGPAAAAPDRVYAIGGTGWTLERFGGDLAVLRARMTSVPPRANASGALLLTCEGRERRMLLDLPQGDLPRAPSSAGSPLVGRVLVARPGGSPQEAFVAKLTIENGTRASLTDGSRDPGARGVKRFVRLLRRRPDRLTLLVSVGTTNLTRDVPIHLVLTFGPQDAVALDDAASTCDSDEPGRSPPAR